MKNRERSFAYSFKSVPMTIKNCGVCLGKIFVRVKSLVSYRVCSCFFNFYLLMYSAAPGLSCSSGVC